jgi:amino acid transporter
MLVVVNVRGVKGAARVVEVLTAAKLAPLLLVAVAGIFALHRQNLAWDHVPTLTELGRASLVLFFAFQGGETAVTASGEIRDPARTIPRALALGIVVVTAFYVGLQFAAQGVLGPELATNQGAPIAATAERLFGPTGLVLVASTAALSTFGTLSGGMLTGPRLLLGFGERGLLPAPFKSLHPRFRTPQVAIIVHGIACAGFALSGTFRQLAVLSGIGTLIVYLLSCPATLKLRARNVRTDAPPFVLPGGPTIPILGTAVALVFLASATRAEYVAASWVFAGASALYLLRPRRPTPPNG